MADLTAFAAVAEELSFTQAARRLQLSQSALSQIVSRLEERLGLRLLERTTRSVEPTDVGRRLLEILSPMLRELDDQMEALDSFRDKPTGTIRITTVEHAAETILYPKLARLTAEYPDITIELDIDYGLADLVSDRFDAGVRLGDQVAEDMIAVPLGPETPMTIVGSPQYFALHARPKTSRDLLSHCCINLKLRSAEAVNPWRLLDSDGPKQVSVTGGLVFNSIGLIREAALDGLGLAYLPVDRVDSYLDSGALEEVLVGHVPPLPPYYLYYRSRRLKTPTFQLVVDRLRYRGDV